MRLFVVISSLVCVLAVQASADDIPRFGMFEKSFSHSGTYDNPYKYNARDTLAQRQITVKSRSDFGPF